MEIEPDAGRIEKLYREQGARMWRALLGFTGDPDVASDAVAEAFAQVIRRGDEIRDPERWVWRSAFKIAGGELRDRRRSSGEDPPSAEGGYEMDRYALDLVIALARLSPKQRAAVVLHHAAGYPLKDVARIVGSTPGAVKVHLARGRTRLRELLGDDYDD